MNKIILVLFVIIAVGAIGTYVFTAQTETQPVVEEAAESVDVADETVTNTEDRYISFSPTALASTEDSRRVLFFYANWCPTCKPADESFFQNMSQIPDDVTVIRVNYKDTETDQSENDLAKKYGITYQHTFVQIDRQGNEVAKWNGGAIDELLANVK